MTTIQEAQSNPILFDKFIDENLGLVRSVTRKYHNLDEYEDYFQCGCIGLFKATKRFKAEFETKFSTYAVPMIVGEIKRYRRDYNAGMKISRSTKELSQKIYYLRSKNFTDEEICHELKITITEIEESDKACQFILSLNEVIGENDHGDAKSLEETLPSDICIESDAIEKLMVTDKLQTLKNLLSEDYFRIFILYISGKTQTQIANRMGVKQAHISRIKAKIMELCKQINLDYEIGSKTIAIKAKPIKTNKTKEVVKVEEVKFSKTVAAELLKDGESPDFIASKFAHQFSGSARVPKMLLVKWGLVESKPKPEPKDGEQKKSRKKKEKGKESVIQLKTEAVRGKKFRYDLTDKLTISSGESLLSCEFSELTTFIAELQQVQKIAQEAV